MVSAPQRCRDDKNFSLPRWECFTRRQRSFSFLIIRFGNHAPQVKGGRTIDTVPLHTRILAGTIIKLCLKLVILNNRNSPTSIYIYLDFHILRLLLIVRENELGKIQLKGGNCAKFLPRIRAIFTRYKSRKYIAQRGADKNGGTQSLRVFNGLLLIKFMHRMPSNIHLLSPPPQCRWSLLLINDYIILSCPRLFVQKDVQRKIIQTKHAFISEDALSYKSEFSFYKLEYTRRNIQFKATRTYLHFKRFHCLKPLKRNW